MAYNIAAFSQIYKQVYGEELSPDSAERKARALLNMYIAVNRSLLDAVVDKE